MKRRELKGAVVVLTGASSGIGRAAAFRFAARGARLVLAARDPDALEDVTVECRDTYGVQAIGMITDVRDEDSVKALAQVAVERFGRIDVWVNDAAVYMLGTIEEVPTEAVRALFLAERPRREAVIGAAPRLMTLFDRVVPWLFERGLRALVDADHLGRQAEMRSSGNLDGPRGPHAVDGGWRARRSPSAKLAAGVRTAALPVLTSGG